MSVPTLVKLILMFVAGWGVLQTAEAQVATRSQIYGGKLTRFTPTAFVRGEYGLQTYDSEVVDGQATGGTTTFVAGGYAGEERQLGIFASRNSTDMTFERNNSDVSTVITDVVLQPRIWWLFPAVMFNATEIQVDATDDTSDLNVKSQGVGAGLGLHVPISDRFKLFADLSYVEAIWTLESEGKDVLVQPRTRLDAGAAYNIWEHIMNVQVGFKYEKSGLKVAGTDFTEVQSSPYAGLQLGIYF